MNATKKETLEIHDDTALLGEALRFTAAETGFIPRLIEKDYFCTLVLQHLCASDETLTFKGGICLAKVYGLCSRCEPRGAGGAFWRKWTGRGV